MSFFIIVAVDKNLGIGKAHRLPWHLPIDLKHFSRLTVGAGNNAVIMGRKTWESLPDEHRPLSQRLNIVVSSNNNYKVPAGVVCVGSFNEALRQGYEKKCEEVFVIGGEKIFSEAILHKDLAAMYLTEIDAQFECDAFFPVFQKNSFLQEYLGEPKKEHGINFRFICYKKRTV